MFQGTIPTKCLEQLPRIVDIEHWDAVYVCCSGTFKIERFINLKYPGKQIFSNDVSLYTTCVGRLAVNNPVAVRFIGKLEFVEEFVSQTDPIERTAAIMLAHEMGRYAGKNLYNQKHYKYYQNHFSHLLPAAKEKIVKELSEMAIHEFNACDFRKHIEIAIEDGKTRKIGVISSPPFYKGGYEKMFEFINENIEWDAPEYDLYDPDDITKVLTRLEEGGLDYSVICHKELEDFHCASLYTEGLKAPHYWYSNSSKSSLRALRTTKASPFKYTPIDVLKITDKSTISVVEVSSEYTNYIKDVYLKSTIKHCNGLFNLFIYIDDMLAGMLIYSFPNYGVGGYKQQECICLLSDLALDRRMKLSKLIATIATSNEIIDKLQYRYMKRIQAVITTVFTDKPMSMKYRGIFKLLRRNENDNPNIKNKFVLRYASEPRQQSIKTIFKKWYGKYKKDQAKIKKENLSDRSKQTNAA